MCERESLDYSVYNLGYAEELYGGLREYLIAEVIILS